MSATDPRLHRIRLGLLAVLAAVVAVGAVFNLATYPKLVDLVIPLRAAERWIAGGQPYLASSFTAGPGYDLPFLYPPFVLPFAAALLAPPIWLVATAWWALAVAVAAWTCRRLAVPWAWVPLVLLWPPFFEALMGANVQVLLFAAFVALLFGRPDPAAPWRPVERDPAAADRPALADGLLGVVNGAVKASQLQPLAFLLRRRPAAALLGAGAALLLVAATLPLTGIEPWRDWVAQLGRAADPGWGLIGSSYLQYLPGPVALAIVAATVVLAFAVPPRHAAAWLGILMIVGNPSLRIFGLLFLLPGLLLIRRELALLAAILVATYFPPAIWLAVGGTAVTLVLGRARPGLLEPITAPGSTTG